jgi:25S rRNA (uracil2634-N3)-methyltransferase
MNGHVVARRPDAVLADKNKNKKKKNKQARGGLLCAFGGGAGGTQSKKRSVSAINSQDSSRGVQVVVAGSAALIDVVQAASNPLRTGVFRSGERVLLVGEGDFSFAAALATLYGGSNIVASSLDSRRIVLEKYVDDAATALAGLKAAGARVLHDVNATSEDDLQRCLGTWPHVDAVAFNFPHMGGSTKEAVLNNQTMLSEFFKAVRCVLRPLNRGAESGKVHVTLRSTPFYDSWELERLASEHGFELRSKEPFDKSLFVGYKEVRTTPAVREASATENSFTYTFVLSSPDRRKPVTGDNLTEKNQPSEKKKKRAKLE